MTFDQVRNASKDQVANILGVDVNDPRWSGGNKGLWINLKANILQKMQQDIDAADEQTLRDLVDVPGFIAKFPDFEIDRGELDNKRYIRIWLEGAPEIPVEE